MVKIYVRQEPQGDTFVLDRDFKKRLTKVMRLKAGDSVEVFCNRNHWRCRIDQIFPDAIQLKIEAELPTQPPPKVTITLVQSIAKGDRFEWLIQKATELGITEIFPLISARTIVHPENIDSKIQRWNEISEQAAGQSENSYPAIVYAPVALEDFLKRKCEGLCLLLHERSGSAPLQQVLNQDVDRITIVVGPEGGWSEEETAKWSETGCTKIHLGSRVLRSETAGLVLAAIIQYVIGDFS